MFYLYGEAPDFKAGTERALQLLNDGTVRDWLSTHEGANYAL